MVEWWRFSLGVSWAWSSGPSSSPACPPRAHSTPTDLPTPADPPAPPRPPPWRSGTAALVASRSACVPDARLPSAQGTPPGGGGGLAQGPESSDGGLSADFSAFRLSSSAILSPAPSKPQEPRVPTWARGNIAEAWWKAGRGRSGPQGAAGERRRRSRSLHGLTFRGFRWVVTVEAAYQVHRQRKGRDAPEGVLARGRWLREQGRKGLG